MEQRFSNIEKTSPIKNLSSDSIKLGKEYTLKKDVAKQFNFDHLSNNKILREMLSLCEKKLWESDNEESREEIREEIEFINIEIEHQNNLFLARLHENIEQGDNTTNESNQTSGTSDTDAFAGYLSPHEKYLQSKNEYEHLQQLAEADINLINETNLTDLKEQLKNHQNIEKYNATSGKESSQFSREHIDILIRIAEIEDAKFYLPKVQARIEELRNKLSSTDDTHIPEPTSEEKTQPTSKNKEDNLTLWKRVESFFLSL